MLLTQTPATLREIGECAEALFCEQIANRIAPEDRSKFLALDVNTGDYEIDANEEAAIERLEVKRPNGTLYLMRADGGPSCIMPSMQEIL